MKILEWLNSTIQKLPGWIKYDSVFYNLKKSGRIDPEREKKYGPLSTSLRLIIISFVLVVGWNFIQYHL